MTPEASTTTTTTTGTGDGGHRIDWVLLLLAGLILVFTGVVLACVKWFSNDGQTFQAFIGILNGLIGAFLLRIKPKGGDDSSTRTTTTGEAEVKRP